VGAAYENRRRRLMPLERETQALHV
jgi:hypothetical protein